LGNDGNFFQPDALLFKSIDQHLSETPSGHSPPAIKTIVLCEVAAALVTATGNAGNCSATADFVVSSHFSKNALSEMPVSFSPPAYKTPLGVVQLAG
jgi:hypothetical protein